MKKGDLKQDIRERQLRDSPCQAPLDTSLPPLNSKLKLIKVIEENKVADIELITKQVLNVSRLKRIEGLWEDIGKDKVLLRNMFINCNDTIKEHEAAKHRFKEKIRDSHRNKYAVLGQAVDVEFQLEDLTQVKAQMEQRVSEYSIYEEFLRHVAQTGAEFSSVGNVLNRFETLENTRKECAKLLEEELNEASQKRRDMEQIVETRNTELKDISNKLIMMQIRQKEAKEQRMYWEVLLHRIKRVMTTKEEEKVVLGGGIWDLYRKMCTRRKVSVNLDESDTEKQLDFIQETLVFYKEVCTIASAHKP